MRLFVSVICGGLVLVLLGGFAALYWWVPRLKFALLSSGAAVSGSELILITTSDIVVNYFYLVLPAILVACAGLFRWAFDGEPEPPPPNA